MFNFKKIIKYKLHWTIWGIILSSIVLFSAYQVNIKAMGTKVFAGRVTAMIPMATCTQYEYDICAVCNLCGCGQWDQDIIAPIFGKTSNQSYYACKMPAYMPMGKGNLMPGSVAFGYCPSTTLTAYNSVCNIWSMYQ